MFDKMLVLPDTIDFNTITYTDVTHSNENYYSIVKLFYFGIVEGHDKKLFKPNDNVTLNEMALMLDIIDVLQISVES